MVEIIPSNRASCCSHLRKIQTTEVYLILAMICEEGGTQSPLCKNTTEMELTDDFTVRLIAPLLCLPLATAHPHSCSLTTPVKPSRKTACLYGQSERPVIQRWTTQGQLEFCFTNICHPVPYTCTHH